MPADFDNARPYVAKVIGDESQAPSGAVPMRLYGSDIGGGGGSAPVTSVNGEIGDVVLDASDIEVTMNGNEMSMEEALTIIAGGLQSFTDAQGNLATSLSQLEARVDALEQ